MATSDIPIELRTASEDDLKSMKLFSADAIKRIIKQQQDIERFDYDFWPAYPVSLNKKCRRGNGAVKRRTAVSLTWRRRWSQGTCLVSLTHPPHHNRLPLIQF